MPDASTPTKLRNFNGVDGKRAIVSVAILGIVGACYWFMLPGIQACIIPDAPGGANGPWVLRPILALHFGAAAVMTCVTVPAISGRVRRKWKSEDAASGSRYDPLQGSPGKRALFMFKGVVLLLIYAVSLLFYLFSWNLIGPDGIEQRLPWATLHHSFQDIASLESIPDGERSDSLKQNGPWYSITLKSGRRVTMSLDNEGTTPQDLTAMTEFIANRSGLVWAKRTDTRARWTKVTGGGATGGEHTDAGAKSRL